MSYKVNYTVCRGGIKEAPFGIDVSELHLPSWLLFFALHPYTENKNTDVIETQDPIIASAVLTCPLLLPVSGKLVWNEATGNLCHNITPEERSVDKAHCLRVPVKLCHLKSRIRRSRVCKGQLTPFVSLWVSWRLPFSAEISRRHRDYFGYSGGNVKQRVPGLTNLPSREREEMHKCKHMPTRV